MEKQGVELVEYTKEVTSNPAKYCRIQNQIDKQKILNSKQQQLAEVLKKD